MFIVKEFKKNIGLSAKKKKNRFKLEDFIFLLENIVFPTGRNYHCIKRDKKGGFCSCRLVMLAFLYCLNIHIKFLFSLSFGVFLTKLCLFCTFTVSF